MLPILVQSARSGKTVEYGQLAKAAGMPNPRNLNYVLGCIGQTLLLLSKSWRSSIPPIQSLVVSKGAGIPSSGIGEFLSKEGDFHRLPPERRNSLVEEAQRSVFAFRRWSDVLTDLGLEEASQRYSPEQYKAAFERAPAGLHHRQMLAVHYYAPARTVTASQLARALGYSSYKAANLHYGRLGQAICAQLRWRPPPTQTVFALVRFERRDGEWHWVMRPEVASALEMLGWIGDAPPFFPEELPGARSYSEGAVRTVQVDASERSAAARAACIRHYGCACAACGIVLADRYGDDARGLIHVHHLHPLSEGKGRRRVDPIRDLRPVCPTCHAVIHARRPVFSIEEVQAKIVEASTRSP